MLKDSESLPDRKIICITKIFLKPISSSLRDIDLVNLMMVLNPIGINYFIKSNNCIKQPYEQFAFITFNKKTGLESPVC